MNEDNDLDPGYVAARRTLLDALELLAPFGAAVILVGAQAVYLRTGLSDLAIAPYTTDGDLALDPTLLADDPKLETSMRSGGFELTERDGHSQPGMWFATANVDGEETIIPIDLIVPEAAARKKGRRGARLGVHGDRAARRAVGLEAALVDHDSLTLSALDASDHRHTRVEVAGVAALLVAKAHKIHDRVASDRIGRLSDKDAADVYRIMQTAPSADVSSTLHDLLTHLVSADATEKALAYMEALFGHRAGEGVTMAQRALRLAVDEDQVAALCVAFTNQILSARD